MNRPGIVKLTGIGLTVACLAFSPWAGADRLPGKEASLPESVVKDHFYSYLIGLVASDMCGTLTRNQLDSVLKEYRGKTSIPFEKVEDIKRQCLSGGMGREVSITFKGNLHTSIPYSILGYRPGSVHASHTVRFLEWDIDSTRLWLSRKESVELSDVYVFGVCEGWALVDIDAWIDKILGDLLDDTRVIVMALFKYQGDWHGLAAGYDPSGEGRSGIFNFKTNRILIPTPRELRILPSYFRDFVTLTKGIEPPLPPGGRWKPAR